jgi:hypothetical protein
MEGYMKAIIVSIVVALIGWGAWVTLGVADAASEEQLHAIQQRIEDKLDSIQQTILDLHKR